MNRIGSSGSRVPPAVTTMRRPAKSPAPAKAVRRSEADDVTSELSAPLG
jgi:hypothetical protein